MGQLSSIEQDKLLHPVFCQKFSYLDLVEQLCACINYIEVLKKLAYLENAYKKAPKTYLMCASKDMFNVCATLIM